MSNTNNLDYTVKVMHESDAGKEKKAMQENKLDYLYYLRHEKLWTLIQLADSNLTRTS